MRKGVFVVVVFVTAGACAAGPKFDPGARAKAIAPFIDEQTLVVGHVDLRRVDLKAVFMKVAEWVKATTGQDAKEVVEPANKAHRFVTEMVKAGAPELYLVVSLADLPAEPMLVVAPLQPGADERAVRGLLYSGRADGPVPKPRDPKRRGRPRTQVQVVGRAVVRCTWPVWQRVKEITPHERPELAEAFAAAGDTAAQVLLLPTADDRRVIEEMMPQLPKEIGGGPSTALTRGVLWAAAGAEGPPRMSLRIVVQCRDAQAAQDLSQAVARVYKAVAAMEPVRKGMPEIDKFLAMLTPTVRKDRLTVGLSETQFQMLVKTYFNLARTAGRARTRSEALGVRSTVNLRQIGVALQKYAEDHDGRMPAALEDLVKGRYVDKRVLISPHSGKKAYVYIRPPALKDIADPRRTVVVYEDPAAHGRTKTAVLFVDAHVEQMPVSDLLKAVIPKPEAVPRPEPKGTQR